MLLSAVCTSGEYTHTASQRLLAGISSMFYKLFENEYMHFGKLEESLRTASNIGRSWSPEIYHPRPTTNVITVWSFGTSLPPRTNATKNHDSWVSDDLIGMSTCRILDLANGLQGR